MADATEEERRREALAQITAPQEPRGRSLANQAEDRANLEKLWAAIQRGFIATALLLFSTPMLTAQVGSPALGQYRGTTQCEAGRATSTQDALLSVRDSTETITHEAVHRRQLAPGCDSVLDLWSRDLTAKMDAEAEALCVGMRAAGLGEVERKQRAVDAAKWWSQFMGRWSFAEYLTVFDRWCL